jgi:hypothetical protein
MTNMGHLPRDLAFAAHHLGPVDSLMISAMFDIFAATIFLWPFVRLDLFVPYMVRKVRRSSDLLGIVVAVLFFRAAIDKAMGTIYQRLENIAEFPFKIHNALGVAIYPLMREAPDSDHAWLLLAFSEFALFLLLH